MVDVSYYLDFCAKYLGRSERTELSGAVESINLKLAAEKLDPPERIARRKTAIMELLLEKGYVKKQGDEYQPIWEVEK